MKDITEKNDKYLPILSHLFHKEQQKDCRLMA